MNTHPLSIPDFRFFLTARLMSTIAQLCMVIVIGWQTYDIARHTMDVDRASLQLGFIGVAQFMPMFVLTLATGWVADRVDRRFIIRCSTAAELACAAALAWLTWTGSTTLFSIYVVAVLLGAARAFASPAMSAIAPNLVPAAILPTAIALSSIAWQGGSVVGPAIGGYLYALGAPAPYALSAILFALTLACLLALGPLPDRAIVRTGNNWAQMLEGLAYVRGNPIVLGAISLDLFAVLLGGATAMLPVFARDVLHVGAQGLGTLRAAPAVGSALVALVFAFRPLRTGIGVKLLGAVGLFGLATVAFGLSRSWPLSLACLAVLGAADMVSAYIRISLIQIWTPDHMRGRVSAVSQLFISGSNELGEAESGLLGSLIGPVAAVVAGGIGAMVLALGWSRLFPALASARTLDVPDALAAPLQEATA